LVLSHCGTIEGTIGILHDPRRRELAVEGGGEGGGEGEWRVRRLKEGGREGGREGVGTYRENCV